MLPRHLSLNALLTALLAVLLLGCSAGPADARPTLSSHTGLNRSHPTGAVTLPPPPAPVTVAYDTAVGNGVDANGHANLPLRTSVGVGSDGADLITAAPTSLTNATYNGGTDTLTVTNGGNFVSWSSALAATTTYHVTFDYTMSAGSNLRVSDGTSTLWTSLTLGTSGAINILVTTTSGTSFQIQASANNFTGTISNIEVRANTGGIAARRVFVANGGSDARTGAQAQNPATPLATVAAAMKYITPGNGDQIEIAQGSAFAATLPVLGDPWGGYSAVYPMVFQSYDPADPTNEAKHGAATGANRPVLNTGANNLLPASSGAGNSPRYMAVRGLKFGPGPTAAGIAMQYLASTNGANEYWLWENDVFEATAISFQQNATRFAQHIIFRGDSFYGSWASSGSGIGILIGNADYATVEDSDFYHVGWKIGALRSDAVNVGGPTFFTHPTYFHQETNYTIARRNLFVDNSNDGGSFRGGGIYTANVGINNPTEILTGGGTPYNVEQPNGVPVETAYNAFLGSAMIGATHYGWGIDVQNGKPGTSVHHNIIAWAGAEQGYGYAFMNDQLYDQPSYADWHHNIAWQWDLSGHSILESNTSGGSNKIFTTYTNNIWDDPASGSNINIASATPANPYTIDGLLVGLGYTGADAAARYTAFTNDISANPEKHVARTALSLMQAGYGITGPPAPADVTAPTLSSPTGSATGSSTATIGVTTNEANGILYGMVTASATPPTKDQVKANENYLAGTVPAGNAFTQVISSTGAKTANLTGLSAGTYYPYFMHEDAAGNQSAVAAAASFTTAWTPASLPGLALWLEADPTKLYTDAGTTLVSADGQAVQQANDKSGLSHTFSQATLANRPLYKTGSGKPYLLFDGSNDTLKSVSYALTDGTGQHYIAISGSATLPGVSTDTFWSATNASTTDFSRLAASFSGGTLQGTSINGGSSTVDSAAAVGTATQFVAILVITGTTVEVYLDNVSNGSTALSTQGANGSSFVYLGSQNGGLGFLNGKIYGVVHGTGTLSSGDRASLQTYMAGLHP